MKKNKDYNPEYPLANKDVWCHETGFKERCRDITGNGLCPKWVKIEGKNPQTGEELNEWDCVDHLMPMILLQSDMRALQQLRATEALTNEIFKKDREIVRTLQLGKEAKDKQNELIETDIRTNAKLLKIAPTLIQGVTDDDRDE
jgi:hypothetical protein